MKLNEYLKKSKVTKKGFAELVGISIPTLDNILNFRTDIRLSIAVRIIEETKGQVSAQELLPKHIQAQSNDAPNKNGHTYNANKKTRNNDSNI